MAPTPAEIAAAFEKARTALEAGHLDAAEGGLNAILALRPGLPEALFQLARLAARRGEMERARALFEQTLAQKPKEGAVWVEYLLAELWGGAPANARKLATRAGKAGVAAPIRGMLGELAKGAGLRAKVRLPAAAQSVIEAGGPKADAVLRQAIAKEPYAVDLRRARVQVLARGKLAPQAYAEACRAARIAPLSVPVWRIVAQLALETGHLDMAAEAVERLVGLTPKGTRRSATLSGICGRVCAATGQADRALVFFDEAVKAEPKGFDLRLERAQLLQSVGQGNVAEEALRSLLQDAPTFGLAYRALAYGVKLEAHDPVIAQIEMHLADGTLPPEDRRLMQFAMARAMETSQQPARVFTYLKPAKDASFALFPHNHDADLAEVARVCGPVTQALASAPSGTSDAAPIFVTGMPRSGTTLIEQILAAHGQVTGGGELGVYSKVATDLVNKLATEESVTSADLDAVAKAYTDGVAARVPGGAPHVTDKSIHSFLLTGVILATMPKAKVVVVHRDPRDAGLSMYRNHFPDGLHAYTNDLAAIAAHYGIFHRMVTHWREALPDRFYEIRYEDVLADPEAQMRGLLAACDLEWDARCLEFHTAKRKVDTLSFAQVRHPLYQTSKGGWRAYEAELGPLIDGLKAAGVPLPE